MNTIVSFLYIISLLFSLRLHLIIISEVSKRFSNNGRSYCDSNLLSISISEFLKQSILPITIINWTILSKNRPSFLVELIFIFLEIDIGLLQLIFLFYFIRFFVRISISNSNQTAKSIFNLLNRVQSRNSVYNSKLITLDIELMLRAKLSKLILVVLYILISTKERIDSYPELSKKLLKEVNHFLNEVLYPLEEISKSFMNNPKIVSCFSHNSIELSFLNGLLFSQLRKEVKTFKKVGIILILMSIFYMKRKCRLLYETLCVKYCIH